MFGFGKKKIDDREYGTIAIELGMFMRWMEENHHHMLWPPEAKDIARRILDRENFKHTENDLFTIVALATASESKKIDQFRKITGFDGKIDGFCNSIGINKP